MDPHLSRNQRLLYWAGSPNHPRQTNRLYRGMQICASQREFWRSNGESVLALGYGCVTTKISFAAKARQRFVAAWKIQRE